MTNSRNGQWAMTVRAAIPEGKVCQRGARQSRIPGFCYKPDAARPFETANTFNDYV